jgi:hypothetical protein
MGIFYGSGRDEGNELEWKRKLRQMEGTRERTRKEEQEDLKTTRMKGKMARKITKMREWNSNVMKHTRRYETRARTFA